MANFTVSAGKKSAASDFTLKDKTGRNHSAKRHAFHDASGNLAVAAHVAADNSRGAGNATPSALDWKDVFADPSKPNRRQVINLVFKDSGGQPVTAFDPPVEFRVTLTPAEQASANVQLVYYDPNARQWKSFAGATRAGSEIVASISAWFDDPCVGVDAS